MNEEFYCPKSKRPSVTYNESQSGIGIVQLNKPDAIFCKVSNLVKVKFPADK